MSDEVHEQQARVWARQRREAGMPEDTIREELSRRGFPERAIDVTRHARSAGAAIADATRGGE